MAAHFSITIRELWSERQYHTAVWPRQAVWYILNTSFGYSISHLAKVYHYDRTTVSHGIRATEERRDTPPGRYIETVERKATRGRR